MSLSNKFCKMGEVNYENRADECRDRSESVFIADGILNEILETAMDMAIKTNINTGMESKKMNIIDELHDEFPETCPEIKDIIDGLSKINVAQVKAKPEEPPVGLDVEMKRLLSEMMSPTYEVINYEAVPRMDGVGDQPMEINPPPEREHPPEELRPSKLVEKKSRITDLVMNSKRVLNNLLDEEERKRQEEFEESNEHVLNVIDLQPAKEAPEIAPDQVPLPFDDSEELLVKAVEENLDNVELEAKGGDGDDVKVEEMGLENPGKVDEKKVTPKKKRWSFNFKFFSFKKNRSSRASNEN